jgi:hypothetical protein
LYFGHILREDRSVLELIDSDYTFLNEKLADFYGIPDVSKGSEMRRVTLPPDSPRGGVLTMGTLLTVTSNPTRTSPVKRGCSSSTTSSARRPPRTPEYPRTRGSRKGVQGPPPHDPRGHGSAPEQRALPLLPLPHGSPGLALENFNALGLWRETERDQAIDASGQLITGESFQDIRDLKKILARERRLDFYRCLTEKLLTYALGRGLEYYDVPPSTDCRPTRTNRRPILRPLVAGRGSVRAIPKPAKSISLSAAMARPPNSSSHQFMP